MKAGRPAYHIKAHWIRVTREDKKSYDYFALDKKGRLISEDGVVQQLKSHSEPEISNIIPPQGEYKHVIIIEEPLRSKADPLCHVYDISMIRKLV